MAAEPANPSLPPRHRTCHLPWLAPEAGGTKMLTIWPPLLQEKQREIVSAGHRGTLQCRSAVGIYLLRVGTAWVCLWSSRTRVYKKVRHPGNNLKVKEKKGIMKKVFAVGPRNMNECAVWLATQTEKPCVCTATWIIPDETKAFPWKKEPFTKDQTEQTAGRLNKLGMFRSLTRPGQLRCCVIRKHLFTKHAFLYMNGFVGRQIKNRISIKVAPRPRGGCRCC